VLFSWDEKARSDQIVGVMVVTISLIPPKMAWVFLAESKRDSSTPGSYSVARMNKDGVRWRGEEVAFGVGEFRSCHGNAQQFIVGFKS